MIQKTIDLYYEQIFEKYPTVPKSDIKKILLYGWKTFYTNNSRGCDILLEKNNFWLYCGNLTKDSLKHFRYYRIKLAKKIKTLYIQQKILWDGYYYFALTQDLYKKYLDLKNTRGRKRKMFNFEKVFLYKIYDECSVANSHCVAIFKIQYPINLGFYLYKDLLKTKDAELIEERDPLRFKDVLISNYKISWQK